MVKTVLKPFSGILKIFFFTMGLMVFAGFSLRSFPLVIISLTGLFVSSLVMAREIRNLKDLCVLLDWHTFTKKNIRYLPVSITIGFGFGIIYRHYLHGDFLPAKLTGFAAVAVAIGSTEEILFRGYLQSQIRKYHVVLSVFIATCAHTGYKLLLFLPYQHEPDIDLTFLLQWTLLGGLVFALLKEYSKNSMYPVFSHALFDLLVYGDCIITPWWIWG